MHIDPTNLNYLYADPVELDWFLLYCVIGQGKSADYAADRIHKLYLSLTENIDDLPYYPRPLETLSKYGTELHNLLVANRVGNYGRLEYIIHKASKLDLRSATVSDLMLIPGIGPKTARFFLLHTRAGFRGAILDVHILRWLGNYFDDVPERTPIGGNYKRWEERALFIIDREFPTLDCRKADLLIWTRMSNRLDGEWVGQ